MDQLLHKLRNPDWLSDMESVSPEVAEQAADAIERLLAREAILRGLAANDGNPDQEIARRALNLMDNVTELFSRAVEQSGSEK